MSYKSGRAKILDNAHSFQEKQLARENKKMADRIVKQMPFCNFKKMEKKYKQELEQSPRANYIKLKRNEDKGFQKFLAQLENFMQMEKVDTKYNNKEESVILPDINSHKKTINTGNEEKEANEKNNVNDENEMEDMEYNDFENVESEDNKDKEDK